MVKTMKQKYIFLKCMYFLVILFSGTITIGMNLNPSDKDFKQDSSNNYKTNFKDDYKCEKHGCSPLYCPFDKATSEGLGCKVLKQFKVNPMDHTISGLFDSCLYTFKRYKNKFWQERKKAQEVIDNNKEEERKRVSERLEDLKENKSPTFGICLNPSDEDFKQDSSNNYKTNFKDDYKCEKHGCSPLYCPFDKATSEGLGCKVLKQFKVNPMDHTISGLFDSCLYTFKRYKNKFWQERKKAQEVIDNNKEEERKRVRERLENLKEKEKEQEREFSIQPKQQSDNNIFQNNDGRYSIQFDLFMCKEHTCSLLCCPPECNNLKKFNILDTDLKKIRVEGYHGTHSIREYKMLFWDKRKKEQQQIATNQEEIQRKQEEIKKYFATNSILPKKPGKPNSFFMVEGTKDYRKLESYLCVKHKGKTLYCPTNSDGSLNCDGLDVFKFNPWDETQNGLCNHKDLFWKKKAQLHEQFKQNKEEVKKAQNEIKNYFCYDERPIAQLAKLKIQKQAQHKTMTVPDLNKILVGDPVSSDLIIGTDGEPKRKCTVNTYENLRVFNLFPWFKKHIEAMDEYRLPALLALVKDSTCNFTPYEPSRLINHWFSTDDDDKKFSKKKFTNLRTEGLGNNAVKSAYFYLIQLGKDESSKCESITYVDKKGSKNDHDPFPFNLDFNFDIDLLNEDEELDEILKNIELSYIGSLNDLIEFYTKKDGKKYNKGKLIDLYSLALSIDHNFQAMYNLGALYNRNNKKSAAISCYERLESFSPKTIEDAKIQIKPWRQRVKYYKNMTKSTEDTKYKKSCLNQAIKLCKLVSNSGVAIESEKESATKKLNSLTTQKTALVLVQTMKDAISS